MVNVPRLPPARGATMGSSSTGDHRVSRAVPAMVSPTASRTRPAARGESRRPA
jgi:hypothetical protein